MIFRLTLKYSSNFVFCSQARTLTAGPFCLAFLFFQSPRPVASHTIFLTLCCKTTRRENDNFGNAKSWEKKKGTDYRDIFAFFSVTIFWVCLMTFPPLVNNWRSDLGFIVSSGHLINKRTVELNSYSQLTFFMKKHLSKTCLVEKHVCIMLFILPVMVPHTAIDSCRCLLVPKLYNGISF